MRLEVLVSTLKDQRKDDNPFNIATSVVIELRSSILLLTLDKLPASKYFLVLKMDSVCSSEALTFCHKPGTTSIEKGIHFDLIIMESRDCIGLIRAKIKFRHN